MTVSHNRGDNRQGESAWDDDVERLLDSETASLLGASLEPMEPSPALRASLMARVAVTEQERLERLAPVVPLRRRRVLHHTVRVAAAVVLACAGYAAGWSTGHGSAMGDMGDMVDYTHLNQAQDVRRVTDTMPDGHVATLTWSQRMGMTALSLPEEMREAAQGHSLQAWLVKGGITTSLGLYDPEAGSGFTFLDLMPEEGERVLITQEPAGGSEQPTGQPLVTFDVHADGTTTRRPDPQPAGGQGADA
ncbi:anti-sigma factor [Actinomyces faecalis]|uniref:anti-sigma factor n=1 Tax=Actinomyces faecalis TaxID=2722820 RepID=UPI001FD0CB0E|nr:anti-sigma factor [Actinomyces faecalis]